MFFQSVKARSCDREKRRTTALFPARLRSNANSVVIEISDTGCGMDAEFVRHKLFRAFVTTKGAEGMGIGAFQAREYVRLLGGEVEVQSRPGQGTTFSINLPLVTSVAAESA